MIAARLWRFGRDQLSAWLPALLMMLFALGTWWLVRSAPKIPTAAAEQAVSADPDYFMRRFSVRTFDPAGRLKSELIGIEGQHYPAMSALEVKQPHMRSYDEQNRLTVATAQRGVSNDDGSEIKLYGDAVVVREASPRLGGGTNPRVEFRGEFLHAFVDDERVLSDKPVQLTRGNDQFTGDSFDYDEQSGVANLKGRVRGVIRPAAR